MKHFLKIHNIECHSYHGCIDEEAIIGGRFSVDIDLAMDLSKAVETDDLNFTADYVVLHTIVREEMAVRSKVIEHAAGRILKRIKETYPGCAEVKVSLTKFNPPVNGQLGKAIVVLIS